MLHEVLSFPFLQQKVFVKKLTCSTKTVRSVRILFSMFRHIFAKWVTYSDEQWAAIRKYAAIHGNATAVRKFEGDFNGQLSESAVRKEKVLTLHRRISERF